MRAGIALVLTVALCATGLHAQSFPFPSTSPPVAAYSLRLLMNEAVHKELNLDDGQKKKATELGQNATTRLLSVLRDGKKADELAKEIEKDLAFLKPEQFKRLRELTYQQLASIPAGSTVFSRDSKASAELKLTKEQKEKLANREALASVLTAEQKKTLEALQGKKVDPSLLTIGFGSGPGVRQPAVPTILQYLANKAVEAELKTTAKQKETFAVLSKKWRDKVPSQTVASEALVNEARELADSIEKDARAALTPAQAKRLNEIVLQNQKALLLRGERDIFTIPAVAEALKLSEAQKTKLAEIVEKRQQGLLPLFSGDGEAKDLLAAVSKHNDETQKLLLVELSAEQKKGLDGLFGKPFPGRVRTVTYLPFGFDRTGVQTPLYLYLVVRLYLDTPELHKELGLTSDQKQKLTALDGSPTATFGVDEKKMAELAAAAEKELGAILKPEQMKRLGQVMLQQYGRRLSPRSLPRFMEVRKGLGLTKDQLDKLSGRVSGVTLESVLTEDQKTKWKEMLGKPTEIQLVRRGSFFRSNLPGDGELLQTEGVATDLKLSDGQKEKLAGIAKAYQEAVTAAQSERAFQEYQKKMTAAQQVATASMTKLLDDNQKKRLEELKLQQAKQSGLYTLLSRPAVVEGLKLTREQNGRLREVYEGEQSLSVALYREFNSNRGGRMAFPEQGGRGGRAAPEVTRALTAIQANAKKRMEAVLTKEQQDTLNRLLGQPFSGTLPSTRGFRTIGGLGVGFPGGGFGGPPGGGFVPPAGRPR